MMRCKRLGGRGSDLAGPSLKLAACMVGRVELQVLASSTIVDLNVTGREFEYSASTRTVGIFSIASSEKRECMSVCIRLGK